MPLLPIYGVVVYESNPGYMSYIGISSSRIMLLFHKASVKIIITIPVMINTHLHANFSLENRTDPVIYTSLFGLLQIV